MDKIRIEDLEIYAHHGVMKEENILGQKFLLTLELGVDTYQAGRSDELSDSINYAEVAHFVNAYLKEHTFKLIEAAAEHLAEEILLHFPVNEIVVEVKKPWAPILLPLSHVSVKIHRKWHTVCLSIGSNMGDTKANLDQAVALLEKEPKIKVTKISDYLITKPYGGVEQDDFLNAALVLKTLLTPPELLEVIGKIEQSLKRERIVHWGPRTIDLDILLYDDLVVREENLTIPHIEMHKRDFVLRPLVEIAPEATHPLLKKTVYQMFTDLEKACQ